MSNLPKGWTKNISIFTLKFELSFTSKFGQNN